MPDTPLTSKFVGASVADTAVTLYVPEPVATTLAADIDDSEDDLLLVVDSSGAMAPGILVVDDEAIGFFKLCNADQVLELRRGLGTTTPASHTAGATVTFHTQYGALKALQEAVIELQTRVIALEP